MNNTERKRRDVYNDIQDCLESGMTLIRACQIVGYKYYMNPDSIHNLYAAIKKEKEEQNEQKTSN